MAHRYAQGARIVTRRVDVTTGTLPDRHDLLLLIRPGGRLVPADGTDAPASPQPGDIAVLLGPARDRPADRHQTPGSASP